MYDGKSEQRRHGDFTGLAADYASYRPDYAPAMPRRLLSLLGRPAASLDAVDVGAGTGLWTRQLQELGLRSVRAVEPNDDMRRDGEAQTAALGITWSKGTGEAMGLSDASHDLVTMAQSFHWVDTQRALAECHRVLRPKGWFAALWNTRALERSPVDTEVEAILAELKPGFKRVSAERPPASPGKDMADRLPTDIPASGKFGPVVYLEDYFAIARSPGVYLGVWSSAKIQAQLGEEGSAEFLRRISACIAGMATIETTYRTRLWAAERK